MNNPLQYDHNVIVYDITMCTAILVDSAEGNIELCKEKNRNNVQELHFTSL